MSKIPTIVQMSPERGTASPFIADSGGTYPQFTTGKLENDPWSRGNLSQAVGTFWIWEGDTSPRG